MCKTRLRLKLLALLRAGCDPNSVDNEGMSPSDYAEREGQWPQWAWAFDQSGWAYSMDANLCEAKQMAI